MHPYLISQIATDGVHERIRASERERLGREAVLAASTHGARPPRLLSSLQRAVSARLTARPAWSSAFPTIDRHRPEACADGDGA
jgi:hypothetical protein